jgi:glycosyltransferase involved in cell wall biosynthesis
VAAGLVSVVVPAFNAASLVGETIESILAQDHPAWELIVVDDGSTDDTSRVVERYLKAGPVRLFRQPNRGVAAARNLGVREARGELVAFCDSDDLWRPDKLSRQTPLFEDPGVVLVYSGADRLLPDGRVQEVPDRFYDEGRCFQSLLVRNFITCSSAVARRSEVMAAGGFDERRQLMGLEDKHLWIRLSRRGLVRAVRLPLILYRITQGGVSGDNLRMLGAELLCLEDIRRHVAPEAPPAAYRRALRRIHRQYGKYLLFDGRLGPARRSLLKTLALGDLSPRVWGMLALACAPRPALAAVRRLRRRLGGSFGEESP